MNPIRWIMGLGYLFIGMGRRIDSYMSHLDEEDIGALGCGMIALILLLSMVGIILALVFSH